MKLKIAYILVGAERRKGKDTFSTMLVDAIREEGAGEFLAYQDAFARELKEELNSIAENSELDVDMFTEDEELKEKVVRPLAIAWGQARRHFDPGYWVNKVIANAGRERSIRGTDLFEAHDVLPNWLFVVVSDWRFPNEYHRIQELGVPILGIFIERESAVTEPVKDEKANAPLCRELADHIVLNNGSLDDLKASAKLMVARHVATNFRGI